MSRSVRARTSALLLFAFCYLGPVNVAAQSPSVRFMLQHPAHVVALGFGSGLAPRAPGTAGTLAAWAAFVLLEQRFGPLPWGALLLGT